MTTTTMIRINYTYSELYIMTNWKLKIHPARLYSVRLNLEIIQKARNDRLEIYTKTN